MCIRDRNDTGYMPALVMEDTTESKTRIEKINNQLINSTEEFSKTVNENPSGVALSIKRDNQDTVSYTHLDVYKRQTSNIPFLAPASIAIFAIEKRSSIVRVCIPSPVNSIDL